MSRSGGLKDRAVAGRAGKLVHDVEVRGVEGQGGSGQTVSDKVDPEELNGDESFGQAEGGGQEDGDDFTNVGGDQVSDELLHIVVDGSTLLNGGDNGGEVIVSQHHLGSGLGHSSS